MDNKVEAKMMTEDLMSYFFNLLKMRHGFDESLNLFNIDEFSQRIRFLIIRLLQSEAYEEFSNDMEAEVKLALSQISKNDEETEEEIFVN